MSEPDNVVSIKGTAKDERTILEIIRQSLDDDKAIEPVEIDLAGKTEIADWMVVVTGTSQRHLGSMADNVILRLKDAGYPGVTAEGTDDPQTSWVVIDAGDVIVHLFRAETRALYDIEKLWSLLPPARAPGDTGVVVKSPRPKAASRAKPKAKPDGDAAPAEPKKPAARRVTRPKVVRSA